MIRTQVQLTEEQYAALKAASSAEGVSVAELIRIALDRLLETRGATGLKERTERAIAAAGKFRSGIGDLAERHDEYLANAAGDKPGTDHRGC
jgi:Arc/MetJ-type ribon-helix-helix transcriptional regulator